jgi:hypothetical protein
MLARVASETARGRAVPASGLSLLGESPQTSGPSARVCTPSRGVSQHEVMSGTGLVPPVATHDQGIEKGSARPRL